MLQKFSHPIIALGLWILFFALGASPAVAALAAVLPFLFREVAQAEERAIDKYYGTRAEMPWWKGYDLRLWDLHSVTDVVYPLITVLIPVI